MTPEQVALVQSNWMKVAPISEQAAAIFYARLFEIAPQVKPLFKGDIKEQGRKLMQTLAFAVHGLANLRAIVPAVQDLGKRHVVYGVKDEHYDVVAAALLWTLEKGLGPEEFTPAAKVAWTEAYTVLATTMKNAAAEMSV